MGAGMSSTTSNDGENTGGELAVSRRKLEDIPESCIALVLGHLDPPEICRLARLNRTFRGASSADFIWEEKLPTNYSFIIHKISELNHKNDGEDDENLKNYCSSSTISDYSSVGLTKKDVYARLSRPNLFDSGNKEIWLDKNTGGVCVSISFKALSITGIDDRRYWNHIPTEESRQLHILFKYGGLKYVGSWSSNSQQGHMVSSFASTSASPLRGLVDAYVTRSIYTDGASDPSDFS